MMDIGICKSFKGFFVERLDGRGEWRYWLPKAGSNYTTGMDALLAAREERDLEITRTCENLVIGERLVIEI